MHRAVDTPLGLFHKRIRLFGEKVFHGSRLLWSAGRASSAEPDATDYVIGDIDETKLPCAPRNLGAGTGLSFYPECEEASENLDID